MTASDVSLVTGATGGMGRACAHRFAALGDHVVVSDLDSDLVDELTATGASATAVAGDLTDPATTAPVATAVQAAGSLRAVAHTAGLSPTMADWGRILAVNLVASVRLLDALEPLVAEGTAAVCVASQAGHFIGAADDPVASALADPLADDLTNRAAAAGLDDPGMAYGWSKWALRRLVVERAPAWGARGGRILSLSPGIVDTPMGRRELAQQPAMAGIIEMTPLGRMGEADEIAAVVEFLWSPAASFVTGTDLLVDGGSTEQVRGTLGLG
mgnify:CR=1 FL=1